MRLQRYDSDATLYDHAEQFRDEESRPLLSASRRPSDVSSIYRLKAAAAAAAESKPGQTPLPRTALTALCAIRLVDPICFTQIFPYVNQMMVMLRPAADPSQVGFYSGMVESVFAVAQLTSIYHWARLSDVMGRKPVVIIGTLGLGAASLGFGLARTFPGVLLARSLAGLCSGNVAVVHSVLGEITDVSNAAVAFPLFAIFWPLGSIVGPLLGGTLANPATKWPERFAAPLWRAHPFLLPCLFAAGVSVGASLLAYFMLEETLNTKTTSIDDNHSRPRPPVRSYGSTSALSTDSDSDADSNSDFGTVNAETDVNTSPPPAAAQAPALRALLAARPLRALCLSGFALSFLAVAFDVLFVLFAYTPVARGGLALSTPQTGAALALAGGASALLQLLALPALLRRASAPAVYAACMRAWPVAFGLLPLLHVLARRAETAGARDITSMAAAPHALLWLALALVLAVSRVGMTAYSINMLLVKRCAACPAHLARANGLAQFAQCLARALAPAFVSALFSATAGTGTGAGAGVWMCGGYAWAGVMMGLSVLGMRVGRGIGAEECTDGSDE